MNRLGPIAALCATLFGAFGCARNTAVKRDPGPQAAASSTASTAPSPGSGSSASGSASAAPAPAFGMAPSGGAPLRFVVIGGGPTPLSNEVSLEQDVQLVSRALTGPSLVLFAGGSESPSVREASEPAGDPVRTALGDLLAPRPGRQSRYRLPSLRAERATGENVERALDMAFSSGTDALFLYLAGHGEQGDTPKDNALALWAGGALSAQDLAELHERHQRPMRVVATTCFSGGFAELAFAHADADAAAPAAVARCGLFAGPADRETSGCDPDPDRRRQASYGVYFIRALSEDATFAGQQQAIAIDLDADGTIGLLEAHTWARINARSIDLPTTTSERWLRRVQHVPAAELAVIPEDQAVVKRLGAALELRDEAELALRLGNLEQQLGMLNDELDEADRVLAQAEAELAAALLERWPVLDDPFHAEFEQTFTAQRNAIAQVLHSELAEQRASALQRMDGLYAELDRIGVDEAMLQRVRRSFETLHLAAALRKRGGSEAAYYESLLTCERSAP